MALDFIAGCVGGAAGVVVGHPLDTVKVRLQTQAQGNAKYRGTFHCLSSIIRQESIAGVYKGISSPLAGVAAVNALIFGVYGQLKPYVVGSPGNDALWAHFLAGSVSGAVQSFIASPMELIKTRMQIDEINKPKPLDVIKKLYHNEGGLFRGIFKGWRITFLREIPAFGIYFSTYEALTSKSGSELSTARMLMAGGTAGVMSWVFTVPIDVTKTRLQCDTSGQYKGIVDCFSKVYRTEGIRSFFTGLNSSIIRAFPTNAATFAVVTWITRYFDELETDSHIQNGKEYLENLGRQWNASIQKKIAFTYALTKPHILHLTSPHHLYYNAYSAVDNDVSITSHGFFQSFRHNNFHQFGNKSSMKRGEKPENEVDNFAKTFSHDGHRMNNSSQETCSFPLTTILQNSLHVPALSSDDEEATTVMPTLLMNLESQVDESRQKFLSFRAKNAYSCEAGPHYNKQLKDDPASSYIVNKSTSRANRGQSSRDLMDNVA